MTWRQGRENMEALHQAGKVHNQVLGMKWVVFLFHPALVLNLLYSSWYCINFYMSLFMPYANSNGADQPAHLCCSLPSSTISLVSNIQSFKTLASFCGCTGWFVSHHIYIPKQLRGIFWTRHCWNTQVQVIVYSAVLKWQHIAETTRFRSLCTRGQY